MDHDGHEENTNGEKSYISGSLLSGIDIEKSSKQKAYAYIKKKIKKENERDYLDKSWETIRELKYSVILKKNKEPLDRLIDETWILFKNLGFDEMNENSDLTIFDGLEKKKVHVFAKDENNVFVIFCKIGEENLKEKIIEISKLKEGFAKSIKKHYNKKFKVSFLIVTRNIENIGMYEELSSKENIFLWGNDTFDSYKYLIEQIGPSAKYQVYSSLFRGRISNLKNIEVPAIYSGKGKDKHYCFVIHPEKLFPFVYVHRRERSDFRAKDIKRTYQRMISKSRVKNIANFINKGNSFPNSLIISFNKEHKPTFKQKDKVENISFGILSFPQYYGCAWIIDGQHRLYGYSKSNKASEHTIPVIAFKSQDVKDQANLFVNINKEQQSVNKNLLWHLYPDIYEGSDDEKHQLLRAISLVVKKLNSDKDLIFYNRIQMPNSIIKDKNKTNLTLTNVCEAIKENRLLDEEGGLLFKKDYDTSINFAVKRINAYFEVVSSFLSGDWEKGNKGLLRTNVGLRIFFSIFRQLLRDIKYSGKKNIYSQTDLSEFKITSNKTLELIKNDLNNKTEDERNEIRKASTKGQVLENTQRLVWELKEQTGFGRELWYKGKGYSPDIPKDQSDKKIRNLLEETEKELRIIIINQLTTKYSNEWWEKGLPSKTVKDAIDLEIEKTIKTERSRKDELDNITPERKLKGFSDTYHLRLIITYKKNWEIFEKIFIEDKQYTYAQFRSFEIIRGKYQHFTEHELTKTMKNLGYWGMKWIREHIGLDTPNKSN